MKIIFYNIMRHICWKLEDIFDYLNPNNLVYPSFKWEVLYEQEKQRLEVRG